MREELIETLRKQAAEISSAGHSGWGNTMLCAADALAAQCGEPVAWGNLRDGKLAGLGMYRDDDIGLCTPLYAAAPPSQPVALPDGWVAVPRASTAKMEDAGLVWLTNLQHMRKQDRRNAIAHAYEAMLAAAPAGEGVGNA